MRLLMNKLYKTLLYLTVVRSSKSMLKSKILFGLLFTSSLLFGQNTDANSDYHNFENRLNELSNSIVELNQYQKNTIALNDSLKKELQYYRIKEDYYSDALGDQSNRFALIVGAIIGLLALISFTGFKIELDRIKKNTQKQLEDQRDEFKKYGSSIKIVESNLKKTSANTFVALARKSVTDKKWVLALEYQIIASSRHAESVLIDVELLRDRLIIEKEVDYKPIVANLKLAVISLNKIKADIALKSALKKKLDSIRKLLDTLNNIDSDDAIDLVAEIRIGLKNYVK